MENQCEIAEKFADNMETTPCIVGVSQPASG